MKVCQKLTNLKSHKNPNLAQTWWWMHFIFSGEISNKFILPKHSPATHSSRSCLLCSIFTSLNSHKEFQKENQTFSIAISPHQHMTRNWNWKEEDYLLCFQGELQNEVLERKCHIIHREDKESTEGIKKLKSRRNSWLGLERKETSSLGRKTTGEGSLD